MLNTRFSYLLGGLALTLLVFFAPVGVNAFTIAPAIIELDVQPGETTRTTIRIENTSDSKRYYAFSIQKFIPKGNLGQQEFLPPEETDGLPEWIFFDRPILELEAGETASLPIIVRVPSDAAPGGHYAAVFFSEQSELVAGSVGIVARTGSLFFVTVGGSTNMDYAIERFAASEEHTSSLPIDFEAEVSNQGNTHFAPEGEIRVTNMFGNTVASYDLNPAGSNILPSSSRVFQVRWEKRPPDSEDLFFGIKEEWRNFGFGKYTATLKVSVDGVEMERQAAVWIFPWRTLTVIGVLLTLILGTVVVRRAVNK
jgi:hypothetical protein